MIIYFSGTGNSRAVAEALASHTADAAVALTSESPDTISYSGRWLVLVLPVYSWGIAPLVLGYIARLNSGFLAEARRHKVWAVLTCGDETGRAPEMLDRALAGVGLHASGIWDVIMPNNYVLLPGFDVDCEEVERRKLERFPERVGEIAGKILSGVAERNFTRGRMPRIKTTIVYPLFRRWGMIPSRWSTSDACVVCGRCAAACPVGNVSVKDGYPRWGADCVSCLACYHVCPVKAVRYGSATRGKGQYFFPGGHKRKPES